MEMEMKMKIFARSPESGANHLIIHTHNSNATAQVASQSTTSLIWLQPNATPAFVWCSQDTIAGCWKLAQQSSEYEEAAPTIRFVFDSWFSSDMNLGCQIARASSTS